MQKLKGRPNDDEDTAWLHNAQSLDIEWPKVRDVLTRQHFHRQVVGGVRERCRAHVGNNQTIVDAPPLCYCKHLRCQVEPVDLPNTLLFQPTAGASGPASQIRRTPDGPPSNRPNASEQGQIHFVGHGAFVGIDPLGVALPHLHGGVVPHVKQ